MSLAATIMTFEQSSALDKFIFAVIAKLKPQSKHADINSIRAHIIKTVDFKDITKTNLQERMNSLISGGKVVNKLNQNKESYSINLDLVDITNVSTLNLSHKVLPNTPTAISYTESTANGPMPDF